MLVPRGWDPLAVAETLDHGNFSGSEVEVVVRQLGVLRELVQSQDPDVRSVGEAGIPVFERAREEAVKEARRKEIAGEL